MGRLSKFVLLIIFFTFEFFLAACDQLRSRTEGQVSRPTENVNISDSPVVQVSGENVIKNSENLSNEYFIDKQIYIGGKSDNDGWYEFDVDKNIMKVVDKEILTKEQISANAGQSLGVQPESIDVYFSPSHNRAILFVSQNTGHEAMPKNTALPQTPAEDTLLDQTNPKGPYIYEVYIFDIKTSQLSDAGPFEGDVAYATWSPNEDYVVVNRTSNEVYDVDSPFGTWIFDTTKAKSSKLDLYDTETGYQDVFVRLVSNDGSTLIYQTNSGGRGGPGDYLYNRNTKTNQKLEIGRASQFWWIKDSSTILFLVPCSENYSYSIRVFDLKNKQLLYSEGECFDINWYSSLITYVSDGGYLFYRHPDETFLVYRKIDFLDKNMGH